MIDPAVQINSLRHSFGQRIALDGITLSVQPGQWLGLLGPNGSGKSTLLRICCTLIPPQSGSVRVDGHDVARQSDEVRRSIGVVFQNPALDKQLTATENLIHHGHLYGLQGKPLANRAAEMLAAVGLQDRAKDRVGKLSGGMRRRVELAKALLPDPKILFLDEPTTGLDPAARIEFWNLLDALRRQTQRTIIVSTHLIDEADRCDQLAILDQGKLVANAPPAELKSAIGGDVLTIRSRQIDRVQSLLKDQLNLEGKIAGDTLRIEHPAAGQLVPKIFESAPGLIDEINVSRPTLEDVFMKLTGRTIGNADSDPAPLPAR